MRDAPVHPSEIDRDGLREAWNTLHVMDMILTGVDKGEDYGSLCDHAIMIYGQHVFREACKMTGRLSDESHSPLDTAPKRRQQEIIRSCKL